jgi:glycosyltransferase involved in cell wall biosynthesis
MALFIIENVIFWLSIFIIFWTYAGYFIFLKFFSIFRHFAVEKKEYYPFISIIITVYNEEKRINQKLENTYKISYPGDKMEIIVASDCSTDNTESIVRSFESKGVKLISFPERHGKHFCQGEAIKQAKGEIVILTDATTFLKDDAVKSIVSNFIDDSIGIVSGKDQTNSEDGEAQGEGFYVRYEMKLRALESKAGSLIGASGSFYAARKSVCKIAHPDLSYDFYLPIVAYSNGYRTILDETAIGYYNIVANPKKEFQRKVRTVVHGIDALYHCKSVLNPFQFGIFAFEMASHKLMRWLAPFAMISALIANIPLSFHNHFYLAILLLQIMFYGLTLFAYLIKKLQNNILFKIPYFFVMANSSILVAWFQFLKGEKYVTWQSTQR